MISYNFFSSPNLIKNGLKRSHISNSIRYISFSEIFYFILLWNLILCIRSLHSPAPSSECSVVARVISSALEQTGFRFD